MSQPPSVPVPAGAGSGDAAVQARKFEAIGRLASGITHEINTPMHYLGTNLGFLETAFRDLLALQHRYRDLLGQVQAGTGVTPDDLATLANLERQLDPAYLEREIGVTLKQSREGIDQVAKMVLALKDVSHPSLHEITLTDLNRCLQSVALITRHEWKRVAELRFDLAADLPLVPCSRDEITQVVLNLVVNAAHAVAGRVKAAGGGLGAITLATRADGAAVQVEVTDDGGGIAPEHQACLFTPGFTTKAAGQGTGQGLAIARDIVVRRHGGELTFTTEPGLGTTFRLRLPLERPAAGASPAGDAP
ncbi:MAG: HAMP domain-containing histidine kinase [Candidatus Riflebacteria bacterium]|nr:HAMP domain-containing histidine kinase [Candidatus Riflebacteria bacterium]